MLFFLTRPAEITVQCSNCVEHEMWDQGGEVVLLVPMASSVNTATGGLGIVCRYYHFVKSPVLSPSNFNLNFIFAAGEPNPFNSQSQRSSRVFGRRAVAPKSSPDLIKTNVTGSA
jgi:hypothetical protein